MKVFVCYAFSSFLPIGLLIVWAPVNHSQQWVMVKVRGQTHTRPPILSEVTNSRIIMLHFFQAFRCLTQLAVKAKADVWPNNGGKHVNVKSGKTVKSGKIIRDCWLRFCLRDVKQHLKPFSLCLMLLQNLTFQLAWTNWINMNTVKFVGLCFNSVFWCS